MDEILELSQQLGELIAKNPIYQTYSDLSTKINLISGKRELLDRYEKSVAEIGVFINKDSDVPEELQKQYEEVATQINNDSELLRFLDAQKRYLALVQSLIQRITLID